MFELSVVVTTYNQERYIANSLASVLAQVGAPLEIVVSDDRSTDNTWDIIERIAATYAGPHTLVVHRQEHNLGAVDNLRWAIDRATAPWIMLADGDDLAMPNRAQVLMKAAKVSGATLVSSNAVQIDAEDKFIGHLVHKDHGKMGWVSLEQLASHGWLPQVLGAAFAFDRQLVTEFGHLDSGKLWAGGDHVLPLRAALMGGVLFVGQPLMCWRRHDQQATAAITGPDSDKRVRGLGNLEHNLIGVCQSLRDLDHWQKSHPDDPKATAARDILMRRLKAITDKWSSFKAELYRDGIVTRYQRRRAASTAEE